MSSDLRTNSDRLLNDLASLAQIGRTADGGVSRPALSPADLEARAWFIGRAEESGLAVSQDGIGNISATMLCPDPDAPIIMLGSHLDTVPNGGRYDGALGVISALEVVRTIKEAALDLPFHFEVMSFTDEEGLWGTMLGSRALAGLLNVGDFSHPRGGRDAFAAALKNAGLDRDTALAINRDMSRVKAWIEVHVEQGPRLEDASTEVGIVTGIVGVASYWLTFKGRADHAGTTPLDRRFDALRGVSEFIRQSRDLIMNRFQGGVMNCGIVEVQNGAFNIVPERARVALEFRHHEASMLEAMREAVLSLALHVVEVEGLGLEVEQVGYVEPVALDRGVHAALEAACAQLGLKHMHMASYAAHDTQIMAGLTQAGLFFVPSVAGSSHSPREFTREMDCVNAANVMLHTVLRLVDGG
jgi:N-carbamoyl-L-amino-acid hydrolase